MTAQPAPAPTLQFLGGAGTVTGSKYLVRAADASVLVDCGLYQGLRELRERNWDPPPFDPATVDAIILTHAHVDHCGALPRLVASGHRGPVFATPSTAELLRIVLPDCAHLLEELDRHDPDIRPDAGTAASQFALPGLREVREVEESKSLTTRLGRAS